MYLEKALKENMCPTWTAKSSPTVFTICNIPSNEGQSRRF
jgi:hypothetical protein